MLYRDGAATRQAVRPLTRRTAGWQQMGGKSGQLYTGHCVIRLRDNTITYRAADATVTTVNFGVPSPPTWTRTSPAASRRRWPAGSPSTVWAAGSSTAWTAIRRPSSASGCRWPQAARARGLSISDLWQRSGHPLSGRPPHGDGARRGRQGQGIASRAIMPQVPEVGATSPIDFAAVWRDLVVCRCLPIPMPALKAYAHPERLVTADWLSGNLGRPGTRHRRIRRGRAALRHRPHPRRGQDRLAHRPQRPARPRLHQRRSSSPS